MHVLTCTRCGTDHAAEHDTEWGSTKESDGYGPEAKCTALVPSKTAPRTRSGDVAMQVCGGRLLAQDVTQDVARAAKVASVTPITPTRR